MSPRHAAILERLTAGVSEEWPRRRISNAPGRLPVVIDRLGPRHFVVGHYFVRDGERFADPAIEFVRLDDGWFPAAITALARSARALDVERGGTVISYDPGEYDDLRSVAGSWLVEIEAEQGGLAPVATRQNGGDR
jgi:hypothetical protein